MERRPGVIFDMDGTLADVAGIRHLVRGTRRDFDAFHRESVNVPPHDDIVAMARDFDARGVDVIIVTARRAKFRNPTAFFLAIHDIPSVALFMRGDRDGRPDVEVKRDILARIRQTHDVVMAVDDNPAVIALWREEGIPVHVVPGFDF